MKRSPSYFSLTLHVRCRRKLEELERLTLRSKANIMEMLLMKATLEDLLPEPEGREEGRAPPARVRGGGEAERPWAPGEGRARRG